MRGLRTLASLLCGATTVALFCATGARAELIGFYSFDDESAAVTAGSGPNGVVSGAAFTLTGYEGAAADFGGTGGRIDFGIDINPDVMPSLTMGGWFNADTVSGLRGLLGQDNGGFDRSLAIDNRGSSPSLTYSAFAGTGVLGGAAPVVDQWTFVAMRHTQGGTLTLFVGDQTFTRSGVSYGLGLRQLTLGRNPSFNEFFDGQADNVFIYNEALSDARVAEIRSGGASAIVGTAVPEPGSVGLVAAGTLGLVGLGAGRRRRRA